MCIKHKVARFVKIKLQMVSNKWSRLLLQNRGRFICTWNLFKILKIPNLWKNYASGFQNNALCQPVMANTIDHPCYSYTRSAMTHQTLHPPSRTAPLKCSDSTQLLWLSLITPQLTWCVRVCSLRPSEITSSLCSFWLIVTEF